MNQRIKKQGVLKFHRSLTFILLVCNLKALLNHRFNAPQEIVKNNTLGILSQEFNNWSNPDPLYPPLLSQ